ncbi:ABC transporter ATP-binding protein [Lentilactobacillus kefiri]|nr:ABC transporter ATP-binding protein [Lentilactobacillus kefiri]MCJ2161427.1 ABC transporter ATP-binding protein [Lentilactobacillus kefiri]MCP9368703.1 ABC transporter ATP-binding protein [Lentilactobacillus kefiri]MDH5107942.1 ABC transporter ATP-binding protein [Lentilactobacillus kefiri]MDM7492301.1 ABC transporter ATP-binding protein [Lentilactobacillus kefiri]PAK60063.1 glycosyl transferase family 2 [Lentilactobacillus kefiri]
MDAVVTVTHVDKSFNKKRILHDVNLTASGHEILGLIGPSGAGKTTIIKNIMGMEQPDDGKVTIFGKEMPNRQVLQRIGFMAQDDALYESLTGRENLKFFAQLFGVKKDQLNERIEYTAGVVNLNQDLDKRVSNYSGGMKRRLSLAISLIQDPDLLVLDEPTVGIDPELRRQIWDELRKYAKDGKSIIITTHVMEDAAECDELLMIRDGHIITHGSPDSLEKKYQVDNLEQVFLKAGKSNENTDNN